MKNIFLWILGLLVSFNLQAQYQSNRFVTGKVIHTQVGASSGKFNVSCNFTDEGGLYDGTNVTVGDLLFVSDGGYGFYLPIDSIISSGVSTVIIRVVNTSLSLGAVPTGVGYITKGSTNFQFQPFVSGISDANQQISNEDFVSRLDSILQYRLPERTDSIPSYTPGANDSRIAQDNDTGIVYYYDGSNWKRIGQDTLDGIYGRSDTIPDALRQVSIDSVLEFIGLDTSGYFLATIGGEFAGGRILIKNNQGKLYFYDALSGTSYLSVNRQGIVLQANTNGTDDIKIQGLTRFNSILTPVTLSATANNYNPTGFANCNVLRLTSTVDVNITGFSNGRNGRLIVVENVGTKTITFVKQNGGSTAANRFATDNVALSAGGVGIAVYDSIASRWRVTGSGSAGTTIDSFYVYNDSLWLRTSTDTFVVDLGLTVVGDDWGSQVANRDSSLSGNGVTPLGIKGYGAASNGQVPSKATGGITWITPLTAEVDGSTTNEIQQIDTFIIVNDVLRNSLSSDAVPFKSVNLSAYRQTIDTFFLSGTTIYNSLSGDNQPAKTINLAGIIYNNGVDSTFVRTNGSYLNKRITSNVTRGGTTTFYGLGGSSTDTTGIVNISQDENSTKPSLWFGENQQWIFKIEKDNRGDSLSNINFFRIFSPDQSVVGDNQVTGWGINVTPGGGKEISTNASISLRQEEKYTYNGKAAFEVHLPDIQFKNSGGIRPFSGVFSHLQADGGYWGMYSDYLLLGDYKTGTQKATWGFGTNTGYNKGITFLDTSYVFFSKALSNSGVYFRDSVDAANITALTVTSGNEVYIGSANTNTTRFGTANLRLASNTSIWSTDHSNILLGNSTNRNNVTINGASTDVLSLRNNVSGSNIWSFGLGATNFFLHDPSGNNLIEAYTNANASLIIANNKWGFGKSPGARLDLKQLTDAAGSGMAIANSTGTSYYWSLNASGDMLWWQTGGSQRMMLTQSGDLLLGTSGLPARKLHVVGEARITDLTTDTPTRIVGADADGDLGALTIGLGLTTSNDSLKINTSYVSGLVNTLYTANGTAADGRIVTLGGDITFNGSAASNGKIFKVDMGTQEIVVTKNGTIALNNSPFFATLTTNQGLYVESSNDGATSLFGIESGDAQSLFFVDNASPEGVTTAAIGSMCFVQNGTTGEVYIKETGSGNTGWVKIPTTGGGGGSDGNGIYGDGTDNSGDDNLPIGGTQVGMNTIGKTLRLVSNTGNTTTREILRLSTVENAFTRFIVATGPVDSARFFRASAGREYTWQTYGGSALTMASDSIVKLVGDSLLVTEDIVPISVKTRFIVGLTDQYYAKRYDGNSANSGDVIVSNGTDWIVAPITNYVTGTNYLLNGGNTNGATVIGGTNDANAFSIETNNVVRSTVTGGASTGGAWTATDVTANTNTVEVMYTNIVNSSGTAATGLGVGTLYQLETTTTDAQNAAEMDVVASDATHATRTFDFVFKTVASANALAEAFRIGGTTYALTATASVSNTNTAVDRFIIRTNSNGTAAANFGGAMLFQGESSTTNNQDMVKLSSIWTVATHASRASALVVSGVNGGGALAEWLRIGPGGIDVNAAWVLNSTSGWGITIGGSSQAAGLTLSNNSNSSLIIANTHNTATSAAKIDIGSSTSFTQTSGTKSYVNFTESFAPTSGTAVHNQLVFDGTFNQTGGANGITRGIYLNQTLTAVADFRGLEIAYSNASAKGIYQTGSATTNNFVGKTTHGSTSTPTALLMLAAGTATANTAPLKLTSGTNLTAAEAGAVEYDGTELYFTPGSTRHIVSRVIKGSATLDFGSTAAGTATDLTVTVTGAVSGDPVYIGVPSGSVPDNGTFFAWVSAADTVTVRYANNDPLNAKDPASGTFKVSVQK